MKFSQQAVLNASPSRYIRDGIDGITDDLGKAAPGGGVINRVADLALLPGRYLLSVARTALEGLGDEPEPAVQPRRTVACRRSASGPDPARGG